MRRKTQPHTARYRRKPRPFIDFEGDTYEEEEREEPINGGGEESK